MQDRNGFTLVELMITIFVASLLTVAFYSTYLMQRKSHTSQGQVVEMQQNLRAAIETMTREMRMAGYDPNETAYVGGTTNAITSATATLFEFSGDLDESGALGVSGTPATENEFFAYDLYNNGGVSTLGRRAAAEPLGATARQPVAEHIEQLEFTYILADGTVTADASSDLGQIRSVRVSLLARSRLPDSNYVNEETYISASGGTTVDLSGIDFYAPAYDAGGVCTNCDNFRRRLVITQIDLRNMGL